MRPFIKQKTTTSKIMRNFLIAILPIIIFAIYKNGYLPYREGYDVNPFYPLIFILTGALSTFLFELVFTYIKDKKIKIKDTYSIIPGLILALILPINTPISILIFGSFMASIFGKMLFGGFGQNVFNPAGIGRLFVISSYAMMLGDFKNPIEIDTISSATPLSNAFMEPVIGTYETLVEPFGGLCNIVLGFYPGAYGETCSLLIMVSLLFLTLTKTIKWRIPVTYITTVLISTQIIGGINDLGHWYSILQICSGGLLFGATFMATDPVTSPVTKKGQYIYGLCLGILTIILRYLSPYPEGVLTSILFMNMLVIIIDKIGIKPKYCSVYLLIIFAFSLSVFIGYRFKNIKTETDPNYQILDIQKFDNKITYTATQIGYMGPIKAEIIIKDGEVLEYNILEQTESYYQKILDANYVDKLLNEQETLKEVDTVSGATVSSTALKKLLLNTLDGYNNKNYEKFEKPDKVENKDFKVLEVVNNLYTVEQKSFGGLMKLNITIDNGITTDIDIISYKDTCVSSSNTNDHYKCPEFIEDRFLKEVTLNNEIDTISGATISSKALKEAIKNTLEVYNEK